MVSTVASINTSVVSVVVFDVMLFMSMHVMDVMYRRWVVHNICGMLVVVMRDWHVYSVIVVHSLMVGVMGMLLMMDWVTLVVYWSSSMSNSWSSSSKVIYKSCVDGMTSSSISTMSSIC